MDLISISPLVDSDGTVIIYIVAMVNSIIVQVTL